MTNYEKYKKDIIFAVANGNRVGVKDGELIMCDDMDCTECNFYDVFGGCGNIMVDWLNAEYVEPVIDWSKVPIDTKVLCRIFEKEVWERRHFAGVNKDGKPCAFPDGKTSWSMSEDYKVVAWRCMKLADTEDEKKYCK